MIRLQAVPFIDITGLQALDDVVSDLRRRGVRVVLCEANERVLGKLDKAGIIDIVGRDCVVASFPAALACASASRG